MRGFERLRDLPGDRQRFVQAQRSPRDAVGQSLTINEFQHQTRRPFKVLDVVYRSNVNVIQRGENLCLALKTPDALDILGKLRRQHLYCHVALELEVARAVYLAHAALAEQTNDFMRTEMG